VVLKVKLQTSSSNIQRNSKLQSPNSGGIVFWELDVEDSLEVGCWNLVLWLRLEQALNRPGPAPAGVNRRYLKLAARHRVDDDH